MAQTFVDCLTRIFNRSKCYSDLDSAMRHASEVAYILADLDQFKKVNDTYGHGVGDTVLRTVAQVFATRCTATPSSLGPYRQGGRGVLRFPHRCRCGKTR
jgi:diguanylate cyclase (GGDEF)-like protein